MELAQQVNLVLGQYAHKIFLKTYTKNLTTPKLAQRIELIFQFPPSLALLELPLFLL